jgi:hypothetical protein
MMRIFTFVAVTLKLEELDSMQRARGAVRMVAT